MKSDDPAAGQQPPLRLPPRNVADHKGSMGHCLLVGGSRGKSGSIALSAMASLRSGAGLVSVAVPDHCLETVAGFDPCLMTIPLEDDGRGTFSPAATRQVGGLLSQRSAQGRSYDAVGCGPGMGTGPGGVGIVQRILELADLPRIIDADGVNVISGQEWACENATATPVLRWTGVVLTPHPGELQRLTGVAAGDRAGQIDAAARLCRRLGCIVVVKGGPTVVVDGRRVWTNTTGNPGMATAGSGDVLTGVLTTLLAQQSADPASPATRNDRERFDRVCLGVWVHGLAGDLAARELGQAGMTATDLVNRLPRAIRSAAAKDPG